MALTCYFELAWPALIVQCDIVIVIVIVIGGRDKPIPWYCWTLVQCVRDHESSSHLNFLAVLYLGGLTPVLVM